MDYLGLFCLGVFVGTIASFGMNKVTDLKEWQTVLTLTLPAVLSGAAMVFIDRFKYSPAFGCYPLGLAVALTWAYTQRAIENVKGESKWGKGVGVAHLLGAFALTLAGIWISVRPALLQIQAEAAISLEERKADIRLYRQASRDGAVAASGVAAPPSVGASRQSEAPSAPASGPR